jgi:UDP-galactopyranose mutase
VDYFTDRGRWDSLGDRTVYTGPLDQFYGCEMGRLEYRSLDLVTRTERVEDWQGGAIVNYCDSARPQTRTTEHRHFNPRKSEGVTVLTDEFPAEWTPGREPYYPVGDTKNLALARYYTNKAEKESRYLFGGRLGSYRYYDMHQVVAQARADAARALR